MCDEHTGTLATRWSTSARSVRAGDCLSRSGLATGCSGEVINGAAIRERAGNLHAVASGGEGERVNLIEIERSLTIVRTESRLALKRQSAAAVGTGRTHVALKLHIDDGRDPGVRGGRGDELPIAI